MNEMHQGESDEEIQEVVMAHGKNGSGKENENEKEKEKDKEKDSRSPSWSNPAES